MAGPNPCRPYSFEELRKIAGRSWLVCEPCNRFTLLPAGLNDRDTRTATFSCSVCGAEAKHVFEDPGKSGKLQFDPRRLPRHHTNAVVRLKVAAEMQRRHEEPYGRVPREDLSQLHRREKSKPEPAPTYVLKLFPVKTFADVAEWGLTIRVDCRTCRRPPVPFEAGENLKGAALHATRLRCIHVIPGSVISPDRVCGGRGRFWLTPPGGVPDAPFIGVCCYNDRHTAVEANYLVANKAPWQGQLGRDERFACPGCGRCMRHTWHTTDTTPQRRW